MRLLIPLVFLLEAVLLAMVLSTNNPNLDQKDHAGGAATSVVSAVGQTQIEEAMPVPVEKTKETETPSVQTVPQKLVLPVPFVTEAPEGSWKSPWINACEEASMVMVDGFYSGKESVEPADAAKKMRELFVYQNDIWGSNANSDADRTLKIIEDNFTTYGARAVINPTIDGIKAELRARHPVISLHYGKDLQNKNIPFATYGSYYHMLVIIGYDDETQEFITNDDGDMKTGAGHRYGYDLLMHSLHDYDFATKKTDKPATVLFTFPK